MSAAAPPIVPPRPVRSQQASEQGASQLPEIPPRPKRLDRSISPGNYPRSPLNEPYGGALARNRSNEPSLLNPIPRPPSVQILPSIGQEGSEYADIQYTLQAPVSGMAADAAAQTRNIAEDLHLHAPKPSLPKSSATAQVQAVTKTDSQQASSQVYGKPGTPSHDEHDHLQRLRSKSSFSRPGSQASTERRRSVVYGDEQGPAELGMRVPINPLLGDVQAPSPAPLGSALTPTHTGHNGEKRRHSRTKSGREVFLPPGSYGLHGHGVPLQDKFEKDWYSKHPEQLQHEEGHGHGVYESIGSGRGNYAMSSDDLNKIVRDTASRGAGFGTSGNTLSYPDEQIGYLASEQYASRSQMASPNYLTKVHSNSSQPANESPLRKSSFPADEQAPKEFRKSKGSLSGKSDDLMESENDEPVHVTEPGRRYNKVTGGEEKTRETEDAVPYASHQTEEFGLADEHGYSAPILASDEVAKEIGSDFMHPAVSPRMDRRGSAYEYEHRSSGDVTPSSRPVSRPGSIYGMHSLNHSLSRFVSYHDESRENIHTPLEDVDEYEPLFPDEDSKNKAMSTADRFKQRPDSLKHRFPSQDIWEDTPSSAMYVATVSTPDLTPQTQGRNESEAKSLFEHPETEASRKTEHGEEEKKRLVPAEERSAKSRFAPRLRDDMPTRPGIQPRFPSQDIWEDSPDSQYLVTTVQSPPIEDDSQISPTDPPAKPSIPPRPAAKSKLSSEISPPTPPSVPARPQKRVYAVPPADAKLTEVSIPPNDPTSKEPSPTEIRKVPSIPDRPKPQIPPRPAKQTSLEGLSKTISSTSAGSAAITEAEKAVTSPPLTKPKPQVPARPAQAGKFAALKGNFLNDLNQKLGVGPPKEKEPEPEVEQEAKPLGDARKGRARGPQRRAPAKSPSSTEESSSKPAHAMFAPKSLWYISSDDGLLNVMSHSKPVNVKETPSIASKEASKSIAESPVPLSDEKISQIDHSTVADAPPAPTIDTTSSRVEDEPSQMALAGPANNIAGKPAESSFSTPPQEKPNVLENSMEESGQGTTLSQHATAGSGAVSGHSLERTEPDPSTDAISISKHTTAESSISGATLQQAGTKVPKEEIQLRNEQVSAPAPEPVAPQKAKHSSISSHDSPEEDMAKEAAAGADRPREPSGEDDVNYKKLEEMTAKADGKGHAAEEEGIKT